MVRQIASPTLSKRCSQRRLRSPNLRAPRHVPRWDGLQDPIDVNISCWHCDALQLAAATCNLGFQQAAASQGLSLRSDALNAINRCFHLGRSSACSGASNYLDELGRTPSSVVQPALVTLGLATLFSSPVTGSNQVLPSLVATTSFARWPMAE